MEYQIYILLSYSITITVLLLATVAIVWRFLHYQKQVKNLQKQKRLAPASLGTPYDT